jgi:hypothetical protein
MHVLAGRLGIPLDASKDASYLDTYITDELIKRLGVVEMHLAKLSKEGTRDTESLDPNILGNDGVNKRLGLIETHLAKLARKDTKDTEFLNSNVLSNGGLEKRLGQIETHLARLMKDTKSTKSL